MAYTHLYAEDIVLFKRNQQKSRIRYSVAKICLPSYDSFFLFLAERSIQKKTKKNQQQFRTYGRVYTESSGNNKRKHKNYGVDSLLCIYMCTLFSASVVWMWSFWATKKDRICIATQYFCVVKISAKHARNNANRIRWIRWEWKWFSAAASLREERIDLLAWETTLTVDCPSQIQSK